MDLDDLHPLDDYSHRFFIYHEWILAYGPLTAENVFDYFATSMFYDKQSNNQVLRMQTMHTGQPILNEVEELKRFTGVEFALVHAQPPSLFIIHKRERLSPEEVRPLAAYFIVNNRIYQSPDLYTVLSNRLLTSLHALQSSLDILRTHRPDFTPRTGFVWPIVNLAPQDSLTKKRTTEEQLEESSESADSILAKANLGSQDLSLSPESNATRKKQQVFLPLLQAMRTTAAHSAATFDIRASSIVPESQRDGSRVPPTPAPTREETPNIQVSPTKSMSQPPPPDSAASVALKQSTAGGKKKKKRMSIPAGATG